MSAQVKTEIHNVLKTTGNQIITGVIPQTVVGVNNIQNDVKLTGADVRQCLSIMFETIVRNQLSSLDETIVELLEMLNRTLCVMLSDNYVCHGGVHPMST